MRLGLKCEFCTSPVAAYTGYFQWVNAPPYTEVIYTSTARWAVNLEIISLYSSTDQVLN